MVHWRFKEFVKTYSGAGGVVVAFLTAIALTWVGICQYRALDEATVLDNRAYVHPEFPDTSVKTGFLHVIDDRPTQKRLWTDLVAIVPFTNYGKTPAYRFRMEVRFESYGNRALLETPWLREDPKQFKGPSPSDSSGAVLAPGERCVEVIKRNLPYWSDQGRWYVYGKIWYVDFRGEPHSTSFGYVWESLRLGFTRMPDCFAAD